MTTLATLITEIKPLNQQAMSKAQAHLDGLIKPVGSLGRLEHLALQLSGMGGLDPALTINKKLMMVMCADHGVYAEGVSAAPQSVTRIQAENMTRHNTGVCLLAAQAGADVCIVDVGIDGDPLPGLVNMKVARGSGNIARGPAMSRQQAEALLLAIAQLTREKARRGVNLFGVGELGMANTTAASAVVSALLALPPESTVGRGANLPEEKLAHKMAVVRLALETNQPDPDDGIDVLAKVGGFDIVAMAGVMLGAASLGLPVVLDGFISCASALAICQVAPGVRPYLIASHRSGEQGAQRVLDALGLPAYLQLEMRLGEGSGAALALPLVDAACLLYHNMGYLADSNITL